MPGKKATEDNSVSQRKRFIETARKLGCHEDEAAFERRLREIGKAKPDASKQKKVKKKPGC